MAAARWPPSNTTGAMAPAGARRPQPPASTLPTSCELDGRCAGRERARLPGDNATASDAPPARPTRP
eukprot:1002256-Lingulodinium_polyedra.AAC.1